MGLDMYLYRAPKGVLDELKSIPYFVREIYEPLITIKECRELYENLTDEDMKLIGEILEKLYERYPILKEMKIRDIDGFIFRLPSEEICYWREANAIHRWFVENVQNGEDDCDFYKVTREQLEELLWTCKKVKENPELASKLLPTMDGFSFGSIEYDEWYFRKLDETIEQLEKVLEEVDFDKYDVIYHSSW